MRFRKAFPHPLWSHFYRKQIHRHLRESDRCSRHHLPYSSRNASLLIVQHSVSSSSTNVVPSTNLSLRWELISSAFFVMHRDFRHFARSAILSRKNVSRLLAPWLWNKDNWLSPGAQLGNQGQSSCLLFVKRCPDPAGNCLMTFCHYFLTSVPGCELLCEKWRQWSNQINLQYLY